MTELETTQPPPAGATILVVDDDALIAMNTVDMLTELGHRVLEAYSGPEALAILEAGQAVDAIITDYSMPGMTGVELALQARRLLPEVPVLLATGHADLEDEGGLALPRIGKPFDEYRLAEIVNRMLGTAPRRA